MLLVYSGLNYPTEYFTNLKKRLTYAAPYLGVIGGALGVSCMSVPGLYARCALVSSEVGS